MQHRVEGADAPFDIVWDALGVAHVYASSVADAYRGMGYAAGRSHRKAELIAQLDAVLQQYPERADAVVGPIAAELAGRKADSARKAAATKVEFFTMVRGENAK